MNNFNIYSIVSLPPYVLVSPPSMNDPDIRTSFLRLVLYGKHDTEFLIPKHRDFSRSSLQ